MTAGFPNYLDDPDRVRRLGLCLESPPAHIFDELCACWWRLAGRGHRLPAQPQIIVIEGGAE